MKPIMSFIFSTLILYTWGYGGQGSVLYIPPIHITDQTEQPIQMREIFRGGDRFPLALTECSGP